MSENLDNISSETNTENKDFQVLTDEEAKQVDGGRYIEKVTCPKCGQEAENNRAWGVTCKHCGYFKPNETWAL